jgi:pyruvate kinase
MKKRTKIVATIGPVTEQYEQLEKLAEKGVNIFRLNFSHGAYE